MNTGDDLKADEKFMSEHPDFHPKTLTLRIYVRWNALYAQLQSIYEQKEQIERFVDSVQHLPAADKLPLLDAEYWTLLEEHMAIMQLFLRVNLLITVEDKPTLAPLLVCVAMLKRLLGPTSDLVLSRMARRARSAEDASTDDIIWTKKDAQLHRLTRSVRVMMLKDLSARYDLDNESRWSPAARQLMICVVALDPRFKSFASKLCVGILGPSSQEEVVWATVRDMAIQHWKFEKDEENEEADAVMSPQPVTRPRTGMALMLSLYMEAGGGSGEGQRHVARTLQSRKDKLVTAIEHYRKMACLDEDSDPLSFWRGYEVPGSVLELLLPLAASIAAVSATEAICERLFKAGGQVLTSARLRLMGSRVESLLMTNYNTPQFGGIQGVESVETEASAGGAMGIKATAAGGAQGH